MGNEPLLRIEAGAHAESVRSIATDPSGRYVATAGADNTVRLWDPSDGRLLRVMRPSAPATARGSAVWSVAFSPDAKSLAVGLFVLQAPRSEYAVHVFDVASGQLERRLGGLGGAPTHLAFSHDGRWLAAAGIERGVRVWNWRDGSAPLAATEPASSFGLDFSRDGRLAVGSLDKRLRLYRIEGGPGLARLVKLADAPAPEGITPYTVAFRPDGQQLAVGVADSPRVVVVDAQRLAPVFWPDVRMVPNRLELTAVAWARDGRTLAAGGAWRLEGRHLMLAWPDGGRGAPRTVATTTRTVVQLAALPAGAFALAGADGAWGVVDAAGKWAPRSNPAALALAAAEDVFFVGRNGRLAAVPVEGASLQMLFDLDARSLRRRTLDTSRESLGAAPLRGGVPVENWLGARPMLRDEVLPLADHERSLAMAVVPGGGSFVLGTNRALRHYDATDGSLRWVNTTGLAARAVNVVGAGPRAGRVVLATMNDGTLRWYRLSDGRELLALFMHADGKRFVLWTPRGYYDASPGGEDLIGWQVNRAPDEMADFFSASRFRARFHRPDVIDRVLDAGDEALALAEADAAHPRREPQAAPPAAVQVALPPVVEVLSGLDVRATAPQITLRARGRSTSESPVTGWRVRVNGQAAGDVRIAAPPTGSVATGADERELTFAVPPADSEVQLFAENRHGTSAAATVRVQWAGAPPPPPQQPGGEPAGAQAFVVQPRLYVLAVGVGAYAHAGVNALAFPAKDARDFMAALQRQRGRLYRDVEVRLLTDAQATRDGVIDGLEWLQRQVTQHDVGMVFIAGHGLNDPDLGYAFLPVNTDPERLRSTAVPMAEFRKTLSALPGKALFFFDTCHSGNVLGPRSRSAFGNDVRGVINELSSAENGVVVFSSSTGRQFSYEDSAWGNGAFTKALVEGLDGKADFQRTGRITHKMLDLYVSERVKALTQGKQSPVTQAPGGVPDYPVAWVAAPAR